MDATDDVMFDAPPTIPQDAYRREDYEPLFDALRQILDHTDSGDLNQPVGDWLWDDCDDNLTHGHPLDVACDVLDKEAGCPPYESHDTDLEQEDGPADNDSWWNGRIRLPNHQDLTLVVHPQVGRASVHRPRARYFEPQPELGPDEQAERTSRSQAANHRRAVRRSSDHAIAHSCTSWVTLTFDDQHLDTDPVEAARDYLEEAGAEHVHRTGRDMKHVGVVATIDGRVHIHLLLSGDVDPEVIHDSWHCGHVHFERIDPADIERNIRYMGKNIEAGRSTHGRFLRSRGGIGEVVVVPVRDFEDAREQLADIVHPAVPRIESAQPFGESPRITFRFDRIEPEDGE